MTGSPLVDLVARAVGGALLHSIWQGALAATAAAAALRLLRAASAQARYVVAWAALAALLGAFSITTARNLDVEGRLHSTLTTPAPSVAPLLGPGPLDFSSAIRDITPLEANPNVAQTSWRARLDAWSQAAVPLWLLGVVLLSLRVSAGWVALGRLQRTRLSPAAAELSARVAALALRVRVSRPVRVAQCAVVHVPSVIGWLRPVLLLPASAISGLSPAQLDAVIAHELAHIRRHDFAVNALQTAADVLLFYHPACWWLSRRIRVEREHCCDDIAVEVCGDRLTYAAALADLEALRQQQPALALAATDGPLLRRVRRLVVPSAHRGSSPWATLALALAVAASVSGAVVVTKAQQALEQTRVPGMGRTIPGDRGVIEGRVVESGTGRPIAGARVEVRGPSDQQYVTADESGRYETRPLLPGSYAVSVTAPGHVGAFYDGRAGSASGHSSIEGSLIIDGHATGAPRIEMRGSNLEIHPSTSIDVGPGTFLSNIDVTMRATGQLSGHILDDRGRPLAGAYVLLVATTADGMLRRVESARSGRDGSYQATAAPGDYVVRAYVDKAVRPSRDAALAYVGTFFPGVRSQDEAQVVRVNSGVEQYDVDFALLSSRTVRVTGTVVDPVGNDLADVKVSLQGDRFGSGEKLVELPLNGRGEFDAHDVVPGTYRVNVVDPLRPARWKTTGEEFEIADDVSGLEIRATVASSITGRVVTDARSTARLNLTQTVISFVNRTPGAGPNMSAFNLDEDGSFHGDVAPGTLTVMIMGPQGWTARAIRLDGVDVFGYPIELAPGAHEIEVVITDRLGSAGGLVVDRRGTPIGGFDVVLFPQDETRWVFASPLIRQTRSLQTGRFELPLLPPGDYLAVATEGVPFLMLGDPAPTLRRLRSIGTPLTVRDGEQKTISIRASPSPLAP